jgi:hypothetical protein
MATITDTIGTGETYTDISLWIAFRVNTGNHYIGECKAEVFGAFSFSDSRNYTAVNFPDLHSLVGAEPDGRAHEVSGKGNARVEVSGATVAEVLDVYVQMSWLELKGPGANANFRFRSGDTANYGRFHHLIIHNNNEHVSAATPGAHLVGVQAAPGAIGFYRNIIYGTPDIGVTISSVPDDTFVANNTIALCGELGVEGGFFDNYILKNNAVLGQTVDIESTQGEQDYNATADGSATEGANSLINLTTADQLVNPVGAPWTATDLTIKSGADIEGQGTTFNPATWPEIDVPINKRGSPIIGPWSMGASEANTFPEMDVQGKGESIPDGSTISSVDNDTAWGNNTVGIEVTHTFTIKNTGDAILYLTDTPRVTITGDDAEFTLDTDAPTSVAIGGSATFIISFVSSAVASYTATISIANNDSDENPYTFAVSGAGVAPEMCITGNDIEIIDGDVTPSEDDGTDFGKAGIS